MNHLQKSYEVGIVISLLSAHSQVEASRARASSLSRLLDCFPLPISFLNVAEKQMICLQGG